MNIVPQPVEAIDAVVVASMSAEEARQCIDEIKSHLNSIRVLLLNLDERRGWAALGYESMRQCLIGEFKPSESRLPQLWRELKAGRIEKHLVPMGTIGTIPERQLQEIGKLPPERWSSAWEEAIATAPPKGITTSHVAKTVAKIKKELENPASPKPLAVVGNTPSADQEVVLGEWVEVRTRHGNATWDGLRGPVTRVEQHEITVQLDEGKWRHLRFYRDELVKVPAPNEELNRMIESAYTEATGSASAWLDKSFYKHGDLVLIDCPTSAEKEYRQWNGCWGKVKSVGRSGSVEVVIGANTIRFKASDLDMIDNPMPILKEIAEHLNQLLSRDDLDELDRQTLPFGF